jgi:hypothetical protein
MDGQTLSTQRPTKSRDVFFIDDLAAELGVSRRTIERRLQTRTFPIPMLPTISRRPMWGRADVERFKAGQTRTERRRG